MATKKRTGSFLNVSALCFLCACSLPVPLWGGTAPVGLRGGIGLPDVAFVANAGQINNERIKFYGKIQGGSVFIADDGELTYLLGNSRDKSIIIREKALSGSVTRVCGIEQSRTRLNFIKGRDLRCRRAGVPVYNRLNMGEVYPGVGLVLQHSEKSFEKVFHVSPGADPGLIRMNVEGAASLTVNGQGQLELGAGNGRIAFSKPVAYQETGQGRRYVPAAYNVTGATYGFQVGSFDRGRELVIDPLLAATFIGGSDDDDWPRSMVIDSQGNVYIAGHTRSTDFPSVTGAFSTTQSGWSDVFIAKFDKDIKNLLAATYYGGKDDDLALSIALDSDGNVCVAGSTVSLDLPTTPGAFQEEHVMGRVGSDGFVAKFDESLQRLVAATYLSGSDGGAEDEVLCIAVAPGGAIYAAGWTDSPNFPLKPGGYKTIHPASPNAINPIGQGFVVKLSGDLSALLAGTFFGPDDECATVYDIAIDSSEKVYITGITVSNAFPTTEGAYDRVLNDGKSKSADLYIAKLDSNLRNLLASTLLGGSSGEQIGYGFYYRTDKALIVEPDGNILITGGTSSDDFPTTPGCLVPSGEYNAVLCRLDSDLKKLLASTYLCASNNSSSIALDSLGNIIVAGNSKYGCPTPAGAYQREEDQSGGAFINKLSGDFTTLLAATYIGGNDSERVLSLAVDAGNNIYITGTTESPDFPVTDSAYRTEFDGTTRDGFVVKFDPNLSSTNATTTIPVECPVALTLGSERLAPFYGLRASLAQSSAGQSLIDAYYRHAGEIAALIQSSPDLGVELKELLLDSIPAVSRYVREKPAAMPPALAARAIGFMNRLIRCGSAELQSDLRHMVRELQSGVLLKKLNEGR